MALTLVVGAVDLSEYARMARGEGFEPADPDYLEPQFSESPLREGGRLVLDKVDLKAKTWPLLLSADTPDELHELVITINRELERAPLQAEWRDEGNSRSTFFDVERARLDPEYDYWRKRAKHLNATLRLWVQPYGHTATERIVATGAGTGALLTVAIPSPLAGDVDALAQFRITVGSAPARPGRIVAIAAIPHPSYAPFIPAGSLPNRDAGATLMGASGAQGSQVVGLVPSQALGAGRATYQRMFDIPLSPASVYAGRQRVLALARSVFYAGNGLRAFDLADNPVGPTAVASFTPHGFAPVDLGVVAIPSRIDRATYTLRLAGGALDTASQPHPRAAGLGTHIHGLQINCIVLLPEERVQLVDDVDRELLAYDSFLRAGSQSLVGQAPDVGPAWVAASGWGPLRQRDLQGGEIHSATNVSAAVLKGVDDTNVRIRAAVALATLSANNGGGARLSLQRNVGSAGFAVLRTGNAQRALSVGGVGAISSVALPSFAAAEYLLEFGVQGPRGWAALRPFTASGGVSDVVASVGASDAVFEQRGDLTVFFQENESPTSPVLAMRDLTVERVPSVSQPPRSVYLLDGVGDRTHRLDQNGVYLADLAGQARGRTPNLSVPSAGRVAVLSSAHEGAPANDLLSVSIAVTERFRFAR